MSCSIENICNHCLCNIVSNVAILNFCFLTHAKLRSHNSNVIHGKINDIAIAPLQALKDSGIPFLPEVLNHGWCPNFSNIIRIALCTKLPNKTIDCMGQERCGFADFF